MLQPDRMLRILSLQCDEARPACAPQLSGPYELTIQLIMSTGPRWVLVLQEQRVRFF
jgi:hypothetical protein